MKLLVYKYFVPFLAHPVCVMCVTYMNIIICLPHIFFFTYMLTYMRQYTYMSKYIFSTYMSNMLFTYRVAHKNVQNFA